MTDFTPPRRLTAEDDADGFDCGLPVVNDWLRNQLRNAGKQHTAVAYVTFCDGAAEIVGAKALLVEPASDRATRFYEHYGFRHIERSGRMFIPLRPA